MRSLLFLLALPAFGQIEMRCSKQSDEIVKELVGKVPKTTFVYRCEVLNTGPVEARLFPSRVGFAAAGEAPMQDPEAALFAAQSYRDSRWWVVALSGLGLIAKYAGPAALGLSTAGIAVPAVVTGIAGGIGGGSAIIEGYRQSAARLTVPATWLRDGMPEIILRPGEPVPYLLALGGKPPETFRAVIPDSRPAQPQPPLNMDPAVFVPTSTHPMLTPVEELIAAYKAELIAEYEQTQKNGVSH